MGLWLTVNIEQYESVPWYGEQAGIKVNCPLSTLSLPNITSPNVLLGDIPVFKPEITACTVQE